MQRTFKSKIRYPLKIEIASLVSYFNIWGDLFCNFLYSLEIQILIAIAQQTGLTKKTLKWENSFRITMKNTSKMVFCKNEEMDSFVL